MLHRAGCTRALCRYPHYSIELALPPLIQCGCSGGSTSCPKDEMKQTGVINRRLRSEIKTDRRREQNKQGQPRFDQLGNVEHPASRRFATARSRRASRAMNRGGFHAATCCGAPGDGALPSCRCETRQQIAEMLMPKHSMLAPTATCVVAISAALLLQIVQPPSAS